MPNKFKPDDLVSHIARGRHNGTVLFTLCGDCHFCQSKQFANCSSDDKTKVIVQWNTNNPAKPHGKFRYNHNDLEWTAIAFKRIGPRKTINGMRPFQNFEIDIKKLGTMTADIESIDDEEPISILPPSASSSKEMKATISPDSKPYADDDEDEYVQWTKNFTDKP